MNAEYLVHRLEMTPHPEGGYYKETYRSKGVIPHASLDKNFTGDRHYSTAIYFLLQQGDYSAFHRIKSDECWHFYEGGTLLIHVIEKDGTYSCTKLGRQLHENELYQFVVPAGAWFASEPAPGSEFSLVGCTVAPGFDFADFEMAEKQKMVNQFPDQKLLLQRLCRF